MSGTVHLDPIDSAKKCAEVRDAMIEGKLGDPESQKKTIIMLLMCCEALMRDLRDRELP